MKIAYDIKLMRPGCAIVAAMMGCNTLACGAFETEMWLLVPTPDMKVYEITDEQLHQLVKKTEEAWQR